MKEGRLYITHSTASNMFFFIHEESFKVLLHIIELICSLMFYSFIDLFMICSCLGLKPYVQ